MGVPRETERYFRHITFTSQVIQEQAWVEAQSIALVAHLPHFCHCEVAFMPIKLPPKTRKELDFRGIRKLESRWDGPVERASLSSDNLFGACVHPRKRRALQARTRWIPEEPAEDLGTEWIFSCLEKLLYSILWWCIDSGRSFWFLALLGRCPLKHWHGTCVRFPPDWNACMTPRFLRTQHRCNYMIFLDFTVRKCTQMKQED